MVVEIPCPVGFVWVTLDGEDPDAPWVVGRYSSRDEDSTEEYTYASFSAFMAAAFRAAALIPGNPVIPHTALRGQVTLLRIPLLRVRFGR